mgnify:CR=1 FL=1
MQLWLAVDIDLKVLGVEKANTSEQAYYQFMQNSVYPDRVILLPDTVTLRVLDDYPRPIR